ncbi:hypothetical protein ACFWPK_22320 [Nocardia sp. NPDC058519]|uniref:hypothetical protein n=1 Tax=Nocardia sp. NPDC058519 TaxID=3346535 RepID=UPI003647F004
MLGNLLRDAARILDTITRLEPLMGAVAESLAGIKDQLTKAQAEIVGKIANLEQLLVDAGKLDDTDLAALAELKSAAQALDDVVPDQVPVEDVPAEG